MPFTKVTVLCNLRFPGTMLTYIYVCLFALDLAALNKIEQYAI